MIDNNIHPVWQEKVPISAKFQHYFKWLEYAGSFMQHLEKHRVFDSKIKILQEKWQIPHLEEQEKLTSDAVCLVREVLIYKEKHYWMFARSVIPKKIVIE